MASRTKKLLAVTIGFLLVGAALRLGGLDQMTTMLSHDEAWNGLDAWSLIEQPRLTPFFPLNFGRESGWMYWLTPSLLILGRIPFALRLTASITGILLLAATYRFGRESLDRSSGVWAAGVIGTFYWANHINHLALRANLFLLVGTLALAALFHAQRRPTLARWIIAGVLVGLLSTTYFAAWLWQGAIGLTALWWAFRQRDLRRDIAIMLIIAGLISLPMLTHIFFSSSGESRIEGVLVADSTMLINNTILWAKALLLEGPSNAMFNLPGRPILDGPALILMAAGLVGLITQRERRSMGLWLVGLAALSIAASALSNESPHYLRGSGAMIPFAMIMGMGATTIIRWARSIPRAKAIGQIAPLLPLILLGWMSANTYRDFQQWLARPEVFVGMEQYTVKSAAHIVEHTSQDTSVYFTPLDYAHPVPRFLSETLRPRTVASFSIHDCLVVNNDSAVYASITTYAPNFAEQLAQWTDVAIITQDTISPPRYTVYEATPNHSLVDGTATATFNEALESQLITLLPFAVRPGDMLDLAVGLQALHPLDRDYSIFVHLYGDPTPYDGGLLWGQADRLLCQSYPTHVWQPDETIIESFLMVLPSDLPSGLYTVALGLYDNAAGVRLLNGDGQDWSVLGTLLVW